MMLRRWLLGTLVLVLATFNVSAADPVPADVIALQDRMKKLIDTAENSVVALVVSHNTKHTLPNATRPWELGEYTSPAVNTFRGRPAERDKLDLSDAKNAGDYTLGSGVVLDADNGLILTCYHLVDGARKIYARLPDNSGSYVDFVGADARSDLAVLRLRSPSAKLTSAKIADVRTHDGPKAKATIARGQWIISLAHPFAAGLSDGQASASWGILSNISRKSALPASAEEIRPGYLYQYSSLLQTDARLNLGCSGGALLNLNGELIGLTSSAAGVAGSESAGGFSIPMDNIYRGIIDVLKTGEEVEYGFLGVEPGKMTGLEHRPGLQIRAVTPGSPAANVGIQAGDIIQAVNGRPLLEEMDLFLLVGGTLAGREVSLSILREREALVFRPKLAKFQHPYPNIVSVRSPAVHGLRVDYSSLLVQQLIGPAMRYNLNWNGVIVRDLEPKSRAETVFRNLPIGQGRWLITKVNDTPTMTPSAFYAAAKKSQVVKLTLVNAMDPNVAEKVITLP